MTVEQALAIALKKINTGGIPEEQIQNAINSFLESHSEYIGATPEQAAQILKNKENIDEIQKNLTNYATKDELSAEVDDLQAVKLNSITLVNTEQYPFNNSEQTIALNSDNERRTTDYIVHIEPISSKYSYNTYLGDTAYVENIYTGKNVNISMGDFVIYDKMTNGFKIAYTGNANEVTVNLTITGGM